MFSVIAITHLKIIDLLMKHKIMASIYGLREIQCECYYSQLILYYIPL